MTDQRTLKKIIAEQREQIEKQKIIIDELNENYLSLNQKYEELQDAIGESERGKTHKSLNCRYDESPSQTNYQQEKAKQK